MNAYLHIDDAQLVVDQTPAIWLASGRVLRHGTVVAEHFGTHAGGPTPESAQADCRRRLIEMAQEKGLQVPEDDNIRAEFDEPVHDDLRGWTVAGRLVKNGNVLLERPGVAPSPQDAKMLTRYALEVWAIGRGHKVIWSATQS